MDIESNLLQSDISYFKGFLMHSKTSVLERPLRMKKVVLVRKSVAN